jgi:hypothetical protein
MNGAEKFSLEWVFLKQQQLYRSYPRIVLAEAQEQFGESRERGMFAIGSPYNKTGKDTVGTSHKAVLSLFPSLRATYRLANQCGA